MSGIQAVSDCSLDDLWQTLSCAGLNGVQVLRLDRHNALAPGNKAFKLAPIIAAAKAAGHRRLLSFGGPWSNHLHALAATGAVEGLDTVGFVRGLESASPTPALRDASGWGMQLVGLDRTCYRRRAEPSFQRQLLSRYGPGLLIPEGGDCPEGAGGCRQIGEAIARATPQGATIVIPVGTGTTLAGVLAPLGHCHRVIGVSALKGALDTPQRIHRNLAALAIEPRVHWDLLQDFHCGGFARVNAELRQLLLDRELAGALPLEPVYTGKAVLALQTLLRNGVIAGDRPVVLVHTGGLQGRRGYPWLEPGPGYQ